MTPTYLSGFGNDFETEALPGALNDKPKLSMAIISCYGNNGA